MTNSISEETRQKVAEAVKKLSHTGHRVHLLMHPDDKPYFQTILEAAALLASGEVVRKDDVINTLSQPVNMMVGYCDSVDALPPSLAAWGEQLRMYAQDLAAAWESVSTPPKQEGRYGVWSVMK